MSEQKIWTPDYLNRESEGMFLQNYLLGRYASNPKNSFVLNINAKWGFGKTYFLENLGKDLENKGHPVVHFDAWENDFTDNPLLAFISELNNSLGNYLKEDPKGSKLFKDAYSTVKKTFVPILMKKLTGHGVEEINDILDDEIEAPQDDMIDKDISAGVSTLMVKAAEFALSEHNVIRDSISTFKNQMEDLTKYIDSEIEAKNLPIFVLVDELDRCRPNYAIELLENIKHIFDIPGIIFVVATDSEQLAYSINAVYGDKFASNRYLKRFFHQEYNLAEPSKYDYAKYLFDVYSILGHTRFFSPLDSGRLYTHRDIDIELFCAYSEYFKLGLRDIEQVVIVLQSIVLAWEMDEKIHLGYLLFLIMLKHQESEVFIGFKSSKNDDKVDFITANLFNTDLVDKKIYLLNDNNSNRDDYTNPNYDVNSLIEFYISKLDFTFGNYQTYSRTPLGIERQILRNIGESIRDSFLDERVRITEYLDSYPELVLRAGQLS